jgi:hypothetical protein
LCPLLSPPGGLQANTQGPEAAAAAWAELAPGLSGARVQVWHPAPVFSLKPQTPLIELKASTQQCSWSDEVALHQVWGVWQLLGGVCKHGGWSCSRAAPVLGRAAVQRTARTAVATQLYGQGTAVAMQWAAVGEVDGQGRVRKGPPGARWWLQAQACRHAGKGRAGWLRSAGPSPSLSTAAVYGKDQLGQFMHGTMHSPVGASCEAHWGAAPPSVVSAGTVSGSTCCKQTPPCAEVCLPCSTRRCFDPVHACSRRQVSFD